MKPNHSLPVLLWLSATLAVASPQDDGGGPPGRRGPGRMSQTFEIAEKFDTNKDGFLDRAERDEARAWLAEQPQRGAGRRGRPGRAEPREPVELPDFDPEQVSKFPDAGLYDANVLRTIFLDFEHDDWSEELTAFKVSDVVVPARMTVDGVAFPRVGVRFRGNTSFWLMDKKSFDISIDAFDDKQRLYGYKTINLLNSATDPSFLREVLFSRISREYGPAAYCNHVRVVVNGKYYGLAVNAQQFNKDYLDDHFGSRKGVRWKVPPDFSGRGGLMYLGPDLEPYKAAYEAKTGGIKKGDWKDLVELCRVLAEASEEELVEELPKLLDIDQALWFLALDNVLMDSDGYFSRGSDYLLYKDKKGRFHLLSHDNNETLAMGGRGPGGPGGRGPGGQRGGDRGSDRGSDRGGDPGAERPERPPGAERPDRGPGGRGRGGPRGERGPRSPLMGMESDERPLLKRLFGVPEWRRQYLANVRQLADHWLDWEVLGPIAMEYRALIEDAVAADVQGPGLEGLRAAIDGAERSIKSFAAERRKFLLEHESLEQLD